MSPASLSRLLVLASTVTFVAQALAQQSPTVSVKVVKKNGFCEGGANHTDSCARDCDCPDGICTGDIAPTDSIGGVGGDRFVLEIYASEWSPSFSPERLRAWEIRFDDVVFTSGGGGRLNVRTGDRCCMARLPFSSSYECVDLSARCTSDTLGVCDLDFSRPRAAGVYLERYRTDYAFFPHAELPGTDLSWLLAVRAASVVLTSSNARVYADTDAPKYLASIALVASDDACGVFHVELTREPGNTTLIQQNGYVIFDPLTGELGLEGVAIDLGSCEDCNNNGLPDRFDLGKRTSLDCNDNGVPDECDIANGTSLDNFPPIWGSDGIPDECQVKRGEKK